MSIYDRMSFDNCDSSMDEDCYQDDSVYICPGCGCDEDCCSCSEEERHEAYVEEVLDEAEEADRGFSD